MTYVFVSLGIVGSHWGALSSKIQEALGQLHDAKKISTLWKLLRGGWEPKREEGGEGTVTVRG